MARPILVGPDEVCDLERAVSTPEHSQIHPVGFDGLRPEVAAKHTEKADVSAEVTGKEPGFAGASAGERSWRFVSRTPPSQPTENRSSWKLKPGSRFEGAATMCRFAQSVGAVKTTPTHRSGGIKRTMNTPSAHRRSRAWSWESFPLVRSVCENCPGPSWFLSIRRVEMHRGRTIPNCRQPGKHSPTPISPKSPRGFAKCRCPRPRPPQVIEGASRNG